jgi:rsbT co-antagonist protein RsbR
MSTAELERLRAENESLRRRVEELEEERAERATNEQELGRLRRIAAKVPLMVDVFDYATQKSVYKNRDMGVWLGYPPGHLETLGPFALVHPDDVPRMIASIQKSMATTEVDANFQFRMRRADDTYRWFASDSLGFDWNEDGSLKAALIVTYDISPVKEAESSLRAMNERLDAIVAERTASLEEANRRLLAEIELRTRLSEEAEHRARTIRELSTPVVRIWDDVVALPLLGSLDSERAETMTTALLLAVSTSGARFAILDLTAVDVMDTATAEHVQRVVQAVSLLGAEVVISGIRPAVAQTMAGQAITLQAKTLQNLREALRHCIRRLEETHAPRARR